MRLTTVVAVFVCAIVALSQSDAESRAEDKPGKTFDAAIDRHANRMLEEGRQIFRYDTFGDEGFWGGTLKLHQAIEGERFGGVGPGVSPATALAVGLKVDACLLYTSPSPRDS